MFRIVFAALLGLALATTTLAADAPSKPFILAAKSGAVTFQHGTHKALKCDSCHGAKIGKLGPMGKEKGHATCLDCHKKEAKGPAKCADCHKKA
jgi:predicted CXXCH cytochrome family protein